MSDTNPSPDADPSDPYLRKGQTYPQLSPDMAQRIAAFGTEEEIPQGTSLFRRGQRSVDFFLVVDGAIEIFDVDEHGNEHVFNVHRDRQFTGEIDLFNDRQVLVSGRAAQDSRVVRVKRDSFRKLITAESDIGEVLMRAFILRRVGLMLHAQGGVVLVGAHHAADTVRIEQFLTRNGYPHRLVDTETDADAKSFLAEFAITESELPVLIADGEVLRNPPNALVADKLGIMIEIDPHHVHDVVVVGAGPAGLSAAVYAASEGLDTLVIDGVAPGGQAATSSKIENYLGFPTGISGQALAGRAQTQAQKFGARIAVSRAATGLRTAGETYCIALDDGSTAAARAVVIATGARYRKLDIPGYERFEGAGLHYAATAVESQLCVGNEVVVVGGGNSAGQAAVYLSRTVSCVHMIVRSAGLALTMSRYLVDRIEASPRITLYPHTEIAEIEGGASLDHVTWANRKTGARERRRIAALFVMIGAEPNTDWLDGCVALDERGFVKPVGSSLFTTSSPGVFAVGDVRSGSVKRVASAVGEGSVAVQSIHAYLDPELASA